MAVVRVRMTVAYDGSRFRGFALQSGQPGVATVAGTVSEALVRVLGHPVHLTAAGRTDAGVHAWGQVVSFDADPERFETEALARSLNRVLGPAVVVRELSVADPSFDARRSAVARRYRYTVLDRAVPDPFLAATTWHVGHPLALGSLRLACDPVIGEHDFTSFCRAPRKVPDASLVRRVVDARWVDLGDGILRFDIEARSFCHQMVRALVGTMVAIGTGRRRAGEMASILGARSRAAAADLAPPHGLCLWEVLYAEG
ncbi:MAG: tRNA pseudouridine(38-40) synthase TruA [Acidimicrobiales bacterium]